MMLKIRLIFVEFRNKMSVCRTIENKVPRSSNRGENNQGLGVTTEHVTVHFQLVTVHSEVLTVDFRMVGGQALIFLSFSKS